MLQAALCILSVFATQAVCGWFPPLAESGRVVLVLRMLVCCLVSGSVFAAGNFAANRAFLWEFWADFGVVGSPQNGETAGGKGRRQRWVVTPLSVSLW